MAPGFVGKKVHLSMAAAAVGRSKAISGPAEFPDCSRCRGKISTSASGSHRLSPRGRQSQEDDDQEGENGENRRVVAGRHRANLGSCGHVLTDNT
jgi:hypothetical protein